jgi:glutamate--cysteine ligase
VAGDPAAQWARRVGGTELLCVRRTGAAWDVPVGVTFGDWVDGALDPPPTPADLDYHVSTLFPPVRPHGHLEVRYVDAQAGRGWALPVAVLAALLSDPEVAARARAVCAPAAGRWVSAARHGLADRVLHRAAVAVFELAVRALPALEPPGWLLDDALVALARRVRPGLCPADLPAATDPAPGDPAPPDASLFPVGGSPTPAGGDAAGTAPAGTAGSDPVGAEEARA